jgi:peroxiredoxin
MTATAKQRVPEVGELAPDFTLRSTSGEMVTLSSLRGRQVLLAFFPLAFSSTCTAELCEMRDEWGAFEATGVVVLPISVDHHYSLGEYKAKHDLKSDLLSDFKREVSRSYGVLLEDRFYANRAYFVIGPDGVIRWRHVEEKPSLKRTNAELLRAIDAVGA